MKKIVFFVGIIVCFFCFPKAGQALEKNEVQIDNFKMHIRVNSKSEAVPIKNVKVNIYGSLKEENRPFLLGSTICDDDGGMKNLYFKGQKNFDQLHFQYMFGKDDRGYIIRLTDYKYNANHTRAVPTNRIIDVKTVGSISGANGTSGFYVELAKLNNIYDSVYKSQLTAIEAASPYIDTKNINFEPIDMIYDLNLVQIGNSFNRWKGDVKRPVLCINTKEVPDWDWIRTCAVTHEWAHWNMYRVNQLPGAPYETEYTYNIQPETSYKEGWAIFQRHQYTCGLKNEFPNDVQVQNDERLFGISTNFTVKGALYDIYDINYDKHASIEDDPFDIYTLFVNGNHTIEEKDLISEGIMHTLMVDSGAKTFKEFYQYLVANYVDKHSDKTMKQKLIRAMAVNGIDPDGEFILKK